MQFVFMPEKGTIDAIFVRRRLQDYHAKTKRLYMCFVDLENAFSRVPRKVLEWAMRKKGILEVLFGSVMSLYERAKTRVIVDSELSEEFEVKVGMHQGSVLSSFLFAVVLDIATELAIEGVSCDLLYADDLFLLIGIIEGLWNKLRENS